MSKYREIFLPDSLSRRLPSYFNEHSPDESPFLLYILILALQTRSKPGEEISSTLDFRKNLLSELSETYVCLMRVEPDHIKTLIDESSLELLYAINS